MRQTPYIVLFVFSLLSIAIAPFFLPYGGITADTISYVQLADSFPEVKWSLFPLGYPLLIKFFNFFTDDYFWAARILNIVLFAIIGLFSYLKQFYFRETVILLSTKIFFFCFFNSLSEAPFIFLLYFLLYFVHGYFYSERKSYRFYIPAALIMSLMFSVRYSGLYIYIGFGLFYLLHYIRKENIQFWNSGFFRFLFLSGVGIGAYALFNFINFGDFAGEKFRHNPYLKGIGEEFFRNVLGVFNSFNPVLGIKLNSSSLLAYSVEGILLLINIVFIYFMVRIWKNHFRSYSKDFHVLLLSTGLVYSVFVFFTVFFQGIEELNMRILAESSFLYFYSVIFICYQEKKYEKIIFRLAVFSLLFNTFYPLKNSSNFLERKAFTEKKLTAMEGKKYYFIKDFKKVKPKVYKIPVINKEFSYGHENLQNSFIDGNIIMMKNPDILWILKDTVLQKEQVIYSTDLE